MKKRFIFSILSLIFLLSSPNTFAQEYSKSLTAAQVHYERAYNGSSYTYGTHTFEAKAVGGENPSGVQYDYRTLYTYTFSDIPQNAQIKSATFKAYMMNAFSTTVTASVRFIRDDADFSTNSAAYNAIDDGEQMAYIPETGTKTVDLKDLIQQKVSAGQTTLRLGAYSVQTNKPDYIHMEFTITYDKPVPITFKNNPNYGKITVNGTQYNSGTAINILTSSTVTISAVDQTTTYTDGAYYIWNEDGTTNKSVWKKTLSGGTVSDSAYTRAYSFTVKDADKNSSVEATLRKAYKVTRTDKTEFDGDFTNQATIYVVAGKSASMPAPATKTVGPRTYNFGGWGGVNGSNFTPTYNMAVTALYKMHLLTTNYTGYKPGGQTKYIVDPYRSGQPSYIVYESMGKIWFSRGAANGGYGTEILVSQGQEFGLDLVEAKNPSIEISNDGSNFLFITYQAKYADESEMLVMKVYNVANTCVGSAIVNYYVPYTHDAGAMLSSYSTMVTIVYKPSPTSKLWQTSYAKNGLDAWPLFEDFELSFTTSTSSNPSYAFSPALGNRDVIVYQNSNTEVLYREYIKRPNDILIYNPITLSASSGYTYNYNPVMKLVESGYPLVYWAARNSSYPAFLIKKRTSGGWTTNFQTGGITDIASMGVTDAADRAVLAWYSGFYNPCMAYVKRDPAAYPATGYSAVIQVPAVTSMPHLSNGYVYLTDIKATSITEGSAPYTIAPLNYDFNYERLNKENVVPSTYGRSITVNMKGTDFIFYLGDIKLNGNNVMFGARPDTLPVNTVTEAAKAMTTETLNLNSGDNLELSYNYYTLQQSLKNGLKENEYVQFILEAVNKDNGVKVNLSKKKFTKDNLQDSLEQIIKIGAENLQSGSYEFRVSLDVNGEALYSLMNHQRIPYQERLAQEQTFDLASGMQAPTVYALTQNYPNPFNPSTVINYAIPQDGLVSLKVYNILGQEVATLVNEFKSAGRYNITFNASQLSTGVYIYRLTAGDYVSVKKMSFVK